MKRKYLRRHRKIRKMFPLILVFLLLGGTFYFLFFSQVFTIKNFSISGERSIDSNELKEAISSFLNHRRFIFAANNFFILKTTELEETILSKFKRIEKVTIQKKIPNFFTSRRFSGAGLKIEVKEKNLNLIWCQQKFKVSELPSGLEEATKLEETVALEERRCFYLDQNGMVFGRPFDIDLENLEREKLINSPFILVEEEGRISNLEERIVAPELVYFIFQIKTTLPKIAGLRMMKGNIIPNSAGEIHIETEEGWQVYFDTTRDITSQVKVLDLVLREKITKEERETLEYIDLRVQGRIYYK